LTVRSSKYPESNLRIVAAVLAVIWLAGGCVSLLVAAMQQRWLFAAAGLTALWYGVIWLYVYRAGRRLTFRESLTPWRLNNRLDV
jgi:FtsH-binding integral membrane protein